MFDGNTHFELYWMKQSGREFSFATPDRFHDALRAQIGYLRRKNKYHSYFYARTIKQTRTPALPAKHNPTKTTLTGAQPATAISVEDCQSESFLPTTTTKASSRPVAPTSSQTPKKEPPKPKIPEWVSHLSEEDQQTVRSRFALIEELKVKYPYCYLGRAMENDYREVGVAQAGTTPVD